MTSEVAKIRLHDGQDLIVDLGDVSVAGPSGVVWGLDSPQLNVNLVTLAAGEAMEPHQNDEVDVVIVIQSGSGAVTVDGVVTDVGPKSLALIPRGSVRSITSTNGMSYLSIHARRPGLSIGAKA